MSQTTTTPRSSSHSKSSKGRLEALSKSLPVLSLTSLFLTSMGRSSYFIRSVAAKVNGRLNLKGSVRGHLWRGESFRGQRSFVVSNRLVSLKVVDSLLADGPVPATCVVFASPEAAAESVAAILD